MYLGLTTDFIKAKKLLKLKDDHKTYCSKTKKLVTVKYLCCNKRIWQLLWRGFSPEEVCEIVSEQYMFWDRPDYWQEKKEGIEMEYKYIYGKGSNRYKDYNPVSYLKNILA